MHKKIKELIEKLSKEGKSLSEIALEVAKLEEAKDLAADAKKLAEAIKTEIRAIEVAAEIEKSEKAQKAEKELDERVEKAVKKTLEGMPALKEDEKEITYFDHVNKKKMSTKAPVSEGLKAFAELTKFVARGDKTNAEAVEKEIISEKQKEYARLGIKAVLRTDATTGSYLVPTEVEASIFEKAYQGVMLSRINTNSVVFNEKVYPVMADMSFGWIADETTAVSDKTPTIGNPSVAMKRFGGIALMSNSLLAMPTGLAAAIANQIGNALQQFSDLNLVVASATGSGSDPITGIAFDANTRVLTAKALANATISDLTALKNGLDKKFRSNAIYLANAKVRDAYGLLENAAGNIVFSQYVNTGAFTPLGKEFVENNMIPSTITVSSKEPLTGTSDIIMALDPSTIYAGFEPLRIAQSEHYKFAEDQFAIRCVSRMGVKVISATGTAGYCAVVQELTA